MIFRLIHKWYVKMAPRERLMLVAFTWVLVLIWLGLVMRQIKTLKADVASKTRDLQTQQAYLNEQDHVDRELKQKIGSLDHSYSGAQLFETVSKLAKECEINTSGFNMLKAQSTDIFKVNSVSLNFRNTPLKNLVKFNSLILQEAPYLAIDEMNVRVNAINPMMMEGDMRVNSLELTLNNKKNPSGTTATAPAKGI